jgi:phosphopantothenoylcysteine decarboxylase / phosphopantothenate---cysteine ligase
VRPYDQRRVLLGVTGGIASYKTVWLARLLTQAGAEVDVVLSRSAREFVGAVTFEAVTGRPVHTELVAAGHALDHIRLARESAIVVVAPATADFLARAAGGHADDLITACLLATPAPVLLVPAMNDRMWAHAQTQRNVAHLRELGYHLLDPDEGPLAVGEGSGPGRMPEPEAIFHHIGRLIEPAGPLTGRHVVVTAGPTREPVDPVRYVSNRSSGRMGVAIASAAWRRGARVTLIAGPLSVGTPTGAEIVGVETTEQMAAAVGENLGDADVLIMAAAPADFRSAEPSGEKIKKASRPDSIRLESTVDILKTTRDRRRAGSVIVGFALETQDLEESARSKLRDKDWISSSQTARPRKGPASTSTPTSFRSSTPTVRVRHCHS